MIDSLSHQAIREAGAEEAAYGLPPDVAGRWRGRRLTGLTAALEGLGHRLDMALPTPGDLAGVDALIVASRSQALMFSDTELASIANFVNAGGGLLLMANHRHFVAPQQQVASTLQLPLKLEDISITGSPDLRVRPHRLTEGCAQIAIRNGSAILPGPACDVLATYADERLAFAVACDPAAGRKGRVVVTADSGFIASLDDKHRPLFETADNARFVGNAIEWLIAAS